jgi:excisionase family DNA binding protein
MDKIKVPNMAGIEETHSSHPYLSKNFLYQLAKSNKIKAIRVGKKILINVDSLNAYLCTNTLSDESSIVTVGGIRPLTIRG